MPPHHVTALFHLVGFLTGAALYAMLFGLVIRRRSGDGLPLMTAILGLLWNAGGLATFVIRDFAGHEPHPLLVATAYSALGFLPAVVVQSVLRSPTGSKKLARFFIIAAYGVSAVAESLMFWSALHRGGAPSPLALQILTVSYTALMLPILLLTRRREGTARAWSIVALAVFAVSALHLSRSDAPQSSLPIELAGHHASIALIFAILYQDFRFALADLFLKRALALFALVAIASGLYFGVEVPLFAAHDYRTDPVAVGATVILWVGTALLYPFLRRGASRIVDRLMLRRPDYGTLREAIAARIATTEEPEEVLRIVAGSLRGPLSAEEIEILDAPATGAILIPTTEEPHYALRLGHLRGGRRLLSDDEALLADVARLAARRIDTIRIARERYEQSRLAAEAELRALRAQMHPHFLFNALNTIGYLIQSSPARAQATLLKLTALLRRVLHSGGEATTLGEELDLVTAYLDIERARFEERLEVEIDVPAALRGIRLPPLTLQPLVENAIKHGVAANRAGGLVAIAARTSDSTLILTVRNTGSLPTSRGKRGVGLENLAARLRHQHGAAAGVTLRGVGGETIAEIRIPA
jgi:hypothetical protein